MIRNYLLISYRNFTRNKIFALVNILGLSVGLACFILILLYVKSELSYDKHHPNHEHIYRISLKGNFGGNDIHTATTSGITGELAEAEIPEITNHVTIFKSQQSVLFRVGEKQFYQEGILFADSSFFKLFSYEFIFGDPGTALTQPNSIVLTESLANKIFGNQNPMDQIIEWENQRNMVVRGVIRDPVHNSHLRFEALVSFNTLQNNKRTWDYLNNLGVFIAHTYVMVSEGTSPQSLAAKLDAMITGHMEETIDYYGMTLNLIPQPISQIHLHSKLVHELDENGDFSNIFIFSAIALLILIIACINFINLSTATSAKRAREVGIRKVFGACRPMLFRQFILESFIITILSLLIAVALVEIFLPYFASQFGIISENNWLRYSYLIISLVSIMLVVGFLSGLFPALIMSSYQPVNVLKGKLFQGSSRPVFRNTLVVVQFVISALIIFSTAVIQLQVFYMNHKDLGIDVSNVIIIPLRNHNLVKKYETIKNELNNTSGVLGVAASSTVVGALEQRQTYYPDDRTRQQAEMLNFITVDRNFFDVFKCELIMGQTFSNNCSLDSNVIIINESMMKKWGWEDPIGRHMIIPNEEEPGNDRKFKIIGVVKDFHFASLHQPISPLLIESNPNYFLNLSVRLDPNNISSTLERIGQNWQGLAPDRPFDYFFLDQSIRNLYRTEKTLGNLFLFFSILALFIASLGLFGLALYTTERRTKEIGIRKVFGGTAKSIVYLLLNDFVKWVLMANLISWPLAWYFMNDWLESFAYRTQIPIWIFLFSLTLSFITALGTVAWQSFRTAVQNPVESLRYE